MRNRSEYVQIENCLEFRAWLKQERIKRANFSLTELAKLTGISKTHLSHLENQTYKWISKDYLSRILNALAQIPPFVPQLQPDLAAMWEAAQEQYPEINNRQEVLNANTN